MKSISVSLFLLFLNCTLFSQLISNWEVMWDPPGNYYGMAKMFETDSEGNIYVAGSIYDMNRNQDVAVIKYDKEGNELWVKIYDIGTHDQPIGIVFDTEENPIIGMKGNSSSVYYEVFHFVKYSKSGELLLGKELSLMNPNTNREMLGLAHNLFEDNFGNIILCGGSNEIIWHMKMTELGTIAGSSTDTLSLPTTLSYYDSHNGFINPSTGDMYVTSLLHDRGDSTWYRSYLTKMDNSGKIEWTKLLYDFGITETYWWLEKALIRNDGAINLAMQVSRSVGDSSSVWNYPKVMQINTDGEIAWDYTFENSPGFNMSTSIDNICFDVGQNILATGSIDNKAFVAKFSGAGEKTWLKRDPSLSVGEHIICDVRDPIGALYDSLGNAVIVKYNEQGDAIYRYKIDGKSLYYPAYVNDMKLDTDKSILLTGANYGSSYYYLTMRITDFALPVEEENLPIDYYMIDNYPNPFNPGTTIRYTVPKEGKISLSIYNLLGEKVVSLLNKNVSEGEHEIYFDASKLTSGSYFCVMEGSGVRKITKMLLLK